MSLAAKLTIKMRLLVRTEIGEDSWGHPLVDEDATIEFAGYFYQYGTEDSDRSGNVTTETGKIIMFPNDRTIEPLSWQAIEFDLLGKVQRWEIIGKPEPKFSMARNGTLHHWECLVSRAAA